MGEGKENVFKSNGGIASGFDAKGFAGSTLKYIAIITMLIDHIGAILVAPMVYRSDLAGLVEANNVYYLYQILRNIGRIAFPIFCFFLVEGFFYTRNVKKYAFRLLLFSLISEIPFDLAFYGKPFTMEGQNVYFTLLIGLGVMYGMQLVNQKVTEPTRLVLARLAVAAVGCILAVVLDTDYHMYGVLSILVLYMYRLEGNRFKQLFMGAITFLWEPWALLAFPLLYLYNGQRGKQLKYLFYAFYPIHILVLYGIRLML